MSDAKKFVKNFSEFVKFCNEKAPETAAAELQSYGLDPQEIGQKGRELAEKLYSMHLQEVRKQLASERTLAQRKAASWISKLSTDSVEAVERAFQDVINGRLGFEAKQYAQSYFKNFKEITYQDKVSLIKDIELLRHLAQEEDAN